MSKRIRITEAPGRVVVRAGGEVIGESNNALVLSERLMSGVFYVPRADIRADVLVESQHSTRCPHKGRASYHHLQVGGRLIENAVWYYPDPIEDVAPIADHLAFYTNRIDSIGVETD